MDLWVRSQDKMTLKKINDLSISQNLFTDEYTIFCDKYVFGDYATKERAIEVLDEVQRYIDLHRMMKFDIYEMPEE